jgi:ribosome-associated heat shock protein Hsp15
MTETPPARQRIDKWLFFARIAKSRTLAQDWVEGGHVSVNGEKLRRSSAEVRPGDRLDVLVDRRTYVLVIRATGMRRGPYEEARLLYEDLSPPPERLTPFEQAQRAPGSGRPEKKDRRALDRLRSRPSSDGG